MEKSWKLISCTFIFLCCTGLLNTNAEIDSESQRKLEPTYIASSPLIDQLRNRVEHLGLDSYFTSNKQLARYIESTGFNVERAARMLSRTARWRKSTGVDKILDWIPSPVLSKNFPYEFTGFTDDGYPVIYIPVGKWNFTAVRQAGFGSEIYRYIIRMAEDIRKSLVDRFNSETEEPIDQVVAIENLEGFDLKNLFSFHDSHLLVLLQYFWNMDRHYPFFAKKYIALRFPLALQASWMVFRQTTPRLRKWIHVYNRFSIRGPRELFHTVPKHAIPVELGGTYISLVSPASMQK